MRNLALIIPTLGNGGAERVIGLLSRALSKIYNTYIFVMDDSALYDYSGQIVRYDEVTNGNETTVEYALSRLKKQYSIDIAISFLEPTNFANIRSSNGEVVIVSERAAQSAREQWGMHYNEEVRKYYNAADAVVACSKGVEFDLSCNLGVKETRLTTIYNYIDKEKILKLAVKPLEQDVKCFLDGKPFFINVGRLHFQKNQLSLINEFVKFHEQDELNARLLIIGSGSLEERIKETINKQKASEYIKLVSYNSNPFRYIARAKATIVASHFEGLPNVILESMTLGVPVISTDCMAGPRELLLGMEDYKTQLDEMMICPRGILVGSNCRMSDLQYADLSSALHWLIRHPTDLEHMITECKRYMSEYSNEQITQKWIDVISKSKSLNNRAFMNEEKTIIANCKKVYIYGAGKRAEQVYNSYSDSIRISGFIVSKYNKDNMKKHGLPIIQVDELSIEPNDVAIIVGVGDRYAFDVISLLKERNYKNIIRPW